MKVTITNVLFNESIINVSGKISYKINGSFDCDVNGKIKNT